MAPEHPISQLGGWEGYEVDTCVQEQRSGRSWCVIRLVSQAGRRHCCTGCLRWCDQVHDTEQRRVRDLPIFEHRVELIVPRARVACPHCGPKLERLPSLAPYLGDQLRLDERNGKAH